MDVSFNNVLESTRQYFQGLPANSPPAGGGSGGGAGAVGPGPAPAAPAATPVQQQQQRPPSVPSSSPSPLSYWPPKAAANSALRPAPVSATNTNVVDHAPSAQMHHHQHQLQPQSHYPSGGSSKAAPHRPLYNGTTTAASTPPSSDVTAPAPVPVPTVNHQRHNLPPIAALTSSYASSRATALARHQSPLPSISQITPHRSSPQQRNQQQQQHHFRSPDYHLNSSYSANNRSLSSSNPQYSTQMNSSHQVSKYSTNSSTPSTASYPNSSPSTASFSNSPTPSSVSYSMSSATTSSSSSTSAQSVYPSHSSSSSSSYHSTPTSSSSSSLPTSAHSSQQSAYPTHSSSSSSSSSYPTPTSTSSLPTSGVSTHSSQQSAYPSHHSSTSYPSTPSSRYQTPQQQYNQQQAALQHQQQQQMQQHYQNALYQQQQQRQQSQSAEMAAKAAADQHYRNQMAAAAAAKAAGGAGRHYSTTPVSHAQHMSQQQQHQAYYSSPGNPVRSSHTTQQPQQPSAPITTIANNSNQQQTMTSQSRVTGLMKRESPLDLSVKTVRQSADSTAKDESENYHNSMSGYHHHEMLQHNRASKTPPKAASSRVPSLQLPSTGVVYPNYQEQSSGESNTTAGAPKVDFLPNFSAPHQNNYQGNPTVPYTPEPKKRSRKSSSSVTQPITTGQYSNSYQNASSAMAVNAAANLKKALPSNLYDYHNSKQNSYYPTTNTASSQSNKTGANRNSNNMYSGLSADAAYLLDVKQFQHQSRMDYLNQQALSSNQPAAESRYPSNKRASTTDLNNPRQAKIPKFDQWKQKFDEQIDQRFKSYASSKLMNEQQQQQQQQHMNGIGVKDSNSSSSNGGVIQQQQQQHYSVYAQQQSRYQSGSSSGQNQIPPPTSSSQSVVSNHTTKHPMYTQPQRMVSESSSSSSVGGASSSGNTYAMNHPLSSTAAMKPHDAYQGGRAPISNTGAANKQVLSILRNSLEIREARNLQMQQQQQQQERSFVVAQDQQQYQQQILHHRGKSYYPLEPMLRMQPQATIPGPPPQNTSSAQSKPPPGVPSPTPPPTGRHNLPPFGAIAVERSTTSTPPYPGYKFHLPKAVDSVLIEDHHHHHHTSTDGARLYRTGGPSTPGLETTAARANFAAPEGQPPPPSIAAPGSDSPTATEMDGLAAFLAARIRTKAELKQVGPGIAGSTASTIPGSNGSVHSPRTTPGIFSPLPAPACTPDIAKGGPSECESAAGGSSGNLGSASSVSTTASPPKLTRERGALISPRRLFRSDDESSTGNLAIIATNATITSLPPAAAATVSQPQAIQSRDTALRSSSEASVFDFRESDSESEMPVLERQSLNELRTGGAHRTKRRGSSGSAAASGAAAGQLLQQSTSQIVVPNEPADPFWSATCDDFLTQLTTGKSLLKRRGRRKKKRMKSPPPSTITSPPLHPPPPPPPPQPKPEKIAKTELPPAVTQAPIKKEKLLPVEEEEVKLKEEKPVVKIKKETVVKEEREDSVAAKEEKDFICDKILEVKAVKLELGESSDEDIPLSKRKCELRKGKPVIKEEPPEKEVCESEVEPSTDEEDNKTSRRLRERKPQNRSVSEEKSKEKQSKKQTRSLSPPPKRQKDKPKKFGDGSKFTPGWEEDLLKYKKSLRMPARLITISRPANWPRATASLPDLDSPLPPDSPLTCDSDMFSSKKADDEHSTPTKKGTTESVVVVVKEKSPSKEEDSFLNRLVQRYGNKGKKSIRKVVSDLLDSSDRKPKKIEKSSDGPELLPTPRLDELIKTPGKKDEETKVKKPRGRKPKKDKDIKDKEPVVHCDSNDNNALYLGYFRKKTVAEFREAFEKHNGAFVGENDLPPVVYESRTRTQTRVLKQQATIREVFGDDRPASAPPAGCRGDEADEKLEDTAKKPGRRKLGITKLVLRKRGNSNSGNRPGLRSAAQLRSSKAVLNSKRQLLHGDERRKRNSDLLKAFATGKKQLEFLAPTIPTKSERKLDSSIHPPPRPPTSSESLTVESTAFSEAQPTTIVGKKLKLRRKLKSSGFDYIRKKKKQQQQQRRDGEMEPPKEKRKSAFSVTKSGLESEQDIQNEIKGWVINKGLGETVLHRAARLGYTDVVAYCLEKLNNNPSPRDNAGYTPLYEACSRNHIEIARLLLLYGANPSDSAQGGIRLLHEAAENGFVEVMRLLLSFGADPLLATYAGHTPLSLAATDEAHALLQHHLADVQGTPAPPWHFNGLSSVLDAENSGNDPVADAPHTEDAEGELVVEYSEEAPLPNLYTLHDEDPGDRWVLFQEVCSALRIKTRDALLRQLGPSHKNDFRDLKLTEFYDQARCCMLMAAGDHLVNPRAHKVILVKYTDQLRSLLKIERDSIPIS